MLGLAVRPLQAQSIFTRKYFAYGLNMDVAGMAERCPDARMLGSACCAGWQFRINRVGLATLVRRPRSKVYGVLWEIGQRAEAALDAFEQVQRGLYRKDTVVLRHGNQVIRTVLVYIAREQRPGRPQPGYLEAIVAAGRVHQLPRAYLRELALGYAASKVELSGSGGLAGHAAW